MALVVFLLLGFLVVRHDTNATEEVVPAAVEVQLLGGATAQEGPARIDIIPTSVVCGATTALKLETINDDVGLRTTVDGYDVRRAAGCAADRTKRATATLTLPPEWTAPGSSLATRAFELSLRTSTAKFLLRTGPHKVSLVGGGTANVLFEDTSGSGAQVVIVNRDRGLSALTCTNNGRPVNQMTLRLWAAHQGYTPADQVFADIRQDEANRLYVLTPALPTGTSSTAFNGVTACRFDKGPSTSN